MKKFKLTLVALVAMLLLAACGSNKAADAYIEDFKKADLTVHEATKIDTNDYAILPAKPEEGQTFGVEKGTDGDYRLANVFTFKNKEDLNKVKKYYEDLAASSELFFSWVAVNEKTNTLIQMNGSVSEKTFNEYKALIEK